MKRKDGYPSFCLLYLCDFGFVLLLCSLQGFKMVSGTVVIHKLPSSLGYTRLRKMEKKSCDNLPQQPKPQSLSKEKNPPLHLTPRAFHALPTQGHSLDTPHRLPREVALGATCDNHHCRGSSSGREQTQPGKAKGFNQQQAPPLDDINVFRTVLWCFLSFPMYLHPTGTCIIIFRAF